jgi:hypothetical protein
LPISRATRTPRPSSYKRMATRLRQIVLLLAISSLHASAQPPIPLFQPPIQQTTPENYRTRVESLRGLVRACRDDAKACNPAAVGNDDKIAASNDTFQVRWQWLRKLLDDARNPALPDRLSLLDQASARLDQELTETSGTAQAEPTFAPARRAANSILARPEFRVVGSQSWFDRKVAQFYSWLNRFFTATSDFGRRPPWLGPVLEWSFVGLSAACILIWAARTMQRQRVAISLSGLIPVADWQKESAEWADLARTEADANNWREAIHCLYWASIVVLESRRLWRRDYARTPREYVALLERNSDQQITLRTLTRIFERIWYGLRHAARADYIQALALFEDLRRA